MPKMARATCGRSRLTTSRSAASGGFDPNSSAPPHPPLVRCSGVLRAVSISRRTPAAHTTQGSRKMSSGAFRWGRASHRAKLRAGPEGFQGSACGPLAYWSGAIGVVEHEALFHAAPALRRRSGELDIELPSGPDPIQWVNYVASVVLLSSSFEKMYGRGACGKPRRVRFSIGSAPSSFARRSSAAGLIWAEHRMSTCWL